MLMRKHLTSLLQKFDENYHLFDTGMAELRYLMLFTSDIRARLQMLLLAIVTPFTFCVFACLHSMW